MLLPLIFTLLADPTPPAPVAPPPVAKVLPPVAKALAPPVATVPVATAALETKRLRLSSEIISYDGSMLDPKKQGKLDFFLANEYLTTVGAAYTLPKNAVTVWLSPKLTLDMKTATPGLTLTKTANGQLLTLAYAALPPMAGRRYTVYLKSSTLMAGSLDQFQLYALSLPKTAIMYTFLLQGKSDLIKRPSDGALVPLSKKVKTKMGVAYLSSVHHFPKAAKRRHTKKQH